MLSALMNTPVGSKLASEKNLAETCRAPIAMIRSILVDFEAAGMISRRPRSRATVESHALGTGTFDESTLGFAETSNRLFGEKVYTQLLDAERRSANSGIKADLERSALEALGLNSDAEFYFICRRRLISDTKQPRVLHSSYLNPAHYGDVDLLSSHDFSKEGLLGVVESYGFTLTSRTSELSARMATPREQADLACTDPTPVLVNTQVTFASHRSAPESIVPVEFLSAVYLDWKFTVKRSFQKIAPGMRPSDG